jgi:Tfp pilus assembly protein PilN
MTDEKDNQSAAPPEAYVEAPVPAATRPAAAKERSGFAGLRVSLIPAELTGRTGLDPRRALVILAALLLGATVLVVVVYLVVLRVSSVRAERIEVLRGELAGLRAETSVLEQRARLAVAFNAQVTAGAAALDGHVYWTGFLRRLEQYVLPAVRCTTLTGDAGGGLANIDCAGRTYRDVAEQITLMRSHPDVLEVRTSSASAQVSNTGEIEGVSFSMSLKMKPSAWAALSVKEASSAAASSQSVQAVPQPELPVGAPTPIVPPTVVTPFP